MVKYKPVMFGFIGIKMVIVVVIVVIRAQNVPSITINLRSSFFYSFIWSNPKSHICTKHLWLFIGQEKRSQHCHLCRKISMIVRCFFCIHSPVKNETFTGVHRVHISMPHDLITFRTTFSGNKLKQYGPIFSCQTDVCTFDFRIVWNTEEFMAAKQAEIINFHHCARQ